ncbi:MAG: DNA polymerase III subunit beta [Ruminococcaceae bacterium]|nr:DNA polymerase III subunit beta [Oscillospiraceae bacterium]
MKIKAEKKVLLEAVTPTLCALSSKALIPALECIYVKAENGVLTITGYDLSKGVRTENNVNIEEEGSLLLNAQKLNSIIRTLPEGMVEITTDKDYKVTIVSGKIKFEIIGLPTDGYPSIPELAGDRSFDIPKGILKKLCQQLLFSVSVDEKRPQLTGINFEINEDKMTLVSCDGFRLSIRHEKVKSNELMQFIVPGRTLSELMKLLDDSDDIITVELTNKHMIMHFDNLYFFSRLVEGEYIDYLKPIPKDTTIEVKVKLDDIIASCERASLVIDERVKSPVKITVAPGGLLLSCDSVNGKVRDEIPASTTGELDIGFNNKYLLDALRAAAMCGEEEVVLRMKSPLVGMSIQPIDHDSFFYLVLPVRLNDENN